MQSKLVRDLLGFWASYRKNKGVVAGLIIILFFLAVGLAAPIIAPNPTKVGVGPRFTPPSWEFPMGTDNLGRDMFQGVVSGARISLLVGFSAAGTSMIIGVIVGAFSGYVGGRVDGILMRITEYFQIVPSFFLALIMVTLLGGSIWNVVIVIAVLSWPRVARLIRAQFLSLKEKEFIEAARAVGESTGYIIFGEILINALPLFGTRQLVHQQMFRGQYHVGCTEESIRTGSKHFDRTLPVDQGEMYAGSYTFSDPVSLHQLQTLRPNQLIQIRQEPFSIGGDL